MEIINDVPDSIRQTITSSSSKSSKALVRRLDTDERRQMLVEDEEMAEAEDQVPELDPSRLRFPEKKALFEKSRGEGGLPFQH